MKKVLFLGIVTITILSGCISIHPKTESLREPDISEDTPTSEPTSEPTEAPIDEPIITFTLEATETLFPIGTPTKLIEPINSANFITPIDVNLAPQYNTYDLNPMEGVIESNAGSEFNGISYQCNSNGTFIPGTKDNHFAYDYGVGNCGRNITGTFVYGMSEGFNGVVVSNGNVENK